MLQYCCAWNDDICKLGIRLSWLWQHLLGLEVPRWRWTWCERGSMQPSPQSGLKIRKWLEFPFKCLINHIRTRISLCYVLLSWFFFCSGELETGVETFGDHIYLWFSVKKEYFFPSRATEVETKDPIFFSSQDCCISESIRTQEPTIGMIKPAQSWLLLHHLNSIENEWNNQR